MTTVEYNLGFEYRKSGFSSDVFKKLSLDLQKIDKALESKYSFNIGEMIYLVSSYVSNKTNKRIWLPTNYFEYRNAFDFCLFYVAGYCKDTQSLVIARLFKNNNYPKHYRIKNMAFIKKYQEGRILVSEQLKYTSSRKMGKRHVRKD
jgi:hypothetical protein